MKNGDSVEDASLLEVREENKYANQFRTSLRFVYNRKWSDVWWILFLCLVILSILKVNFLTFSTTERDDTVDGMIEYKYFAEGPFDFRGRECGVSKGVEDFPFLYFPAFNSDIQSESRLSIRNLVPVCTKVCPLIPAKFRPGMCPDDSSRFCSWYRHGSEGYEDFGGITWRIRRPSAFSKWAMQRKYISSRTSGIQLLKFIMNQSTSEGALKNDEAARTGIRSSLVIGGVVLCEEIVSPVWARSALEILKNDMGSNLLTTEKGRSELKALLDMYPSPNTIPFLLHKRVRKSSSPSTGIIFNQIVTETQNAELTQEKYDLVKQDIDTLIEVGSKMKNLDPQSRLWIEYDYSFFGLTTIKEFEDKAFNSVEETLAQETKLDVSGLGSGRSFHPVYDSKFVKEFNELNSKSDQNNIKKSKEMQTSVEKTSEKIQKLIVETNERKKTVEFDQPDSADDLKRKTFFNIHEDEEHDITVDDSKSEAPPEKVLQLETKAAMEKLARGDKVEITEPLRQRVREKYKSALRRLLNKDNFLFWSETLPRSAVEGVDRLMLSIRTDVDIVKSLENALEVQHNMNAQSDTIAVNGLKFNEVQTIVGVEYETGRNYSVRVTDRNLEKHTEVLEQKKSSRLRIIKLLEVILEVDRQRRVNTSTSKILQRIAQLQKQSQSPSKSTSKPILGSRPLIVNDEDSFPSVSDKNAKTTLSVEAHPHAFLQINNIKEDSEVSDGSNSSVASLSSNPFNLVDETGNVFEKKSNILKKRSHNHSMDNTDGISSEEPVSYKDATSYFVSINKLLNSKSSEELELDHQHTSTSRSNSNLVLTNKPFQEIEFDLVGLTESHFSKMQSPPFIFSDEEENADIDKIPSDSITRLRTDNIARYSDPYFKNEEDRSKPFTVLKSMNKALNDVNLGNMEVGKESIFYIQWGSIITVVLAAPLSLTLWLCGLSVFIYLILVLSLWLTPPHFAWPLVIGTTIMCTVWIAVLYLVEFSGIAVSKWSDPVFVSVGCILLFLYLYLLRVSRYILISKRMSTIVYSVLDHILPSNPFPKPVTLEIGSITEVLDDEELYHDFDGMNDGIDTALNDYYDSNVEGTNTSLSSSRNYESNHSSQFLSNTNIINYRKNSLINSNKSHLLHLQKKVINKATLSNEDHSVTAIQDQKRQNSSDTNTNIETKTIFNTQINNIHTTNEGIIVRRSSLTTITEHHCESPTDAHSALVANTQNNTLNEHSQSTGALIQLNNQSENVTAADAINSSVNISAVTGFEYAKHIDDVEVEESEKTCLKEEEILYIDDEFDKKDDIVLPPLDRNEIAHDNNSLIQTIPLEPNTSHKRRSDFPIHGVKDVESTMKQRATVSIYRVLKLINSNSKRTKNHEDGYIIQELLNAAGLKKSSKPDPLLTSSPYELSEEELKKGVQLNSEELRDLTNLNLQRRREIDKNDNKDQVNGIYKGINQNSLLSFVAEAPLRVSRFIVRRVLVWESRLRFFQDAIGNLLIVPLFGIVIFSLFFYFWSQSFLSAFHAREIFTKTHNSSNDRDYTLLSILHFDQSFGWFMKYYSGLFLRILALIWFVYFIAYLCTMIISRAYALTHATRHMVNGEPRMRTIWVSFMGLLPDGSICARGEESKFVNLVGGYQGRPTGFQRTSMKKISEEKQSDSARTEDIYSKSEIYFPGVESTFESTADEKTKEKEWKKNGKEIPFFWATLTSCRDILTSMSLLGTACFLSFLRLFFFYAPWIIRLNVLRRKYGIVLTLFTIWVPPCAYFLNPVARKMSRGTLIAAAIFRTSTRDSSELHSALVDSIALRAMLNIARHKQEEKKLEEKQKINRLTMMALWVNDLMEIGSETLDAVEEKKLLNKRLQKKYQINSEKLAMTEPLFSSRKNVIITPEGSAQEKRRQSIFKSTIHQSQNSKVFIHTSSVLPNNDFQNDYDNSDENELITPKNIPTPPICHVPSPRSTNYLTNVQVAEIASEYNDELMKLREASSAALNLGHFAQIHILVFIVLVGVLIFSNIFFKSDDFLSFSLSKRIRNPLTASSNLFMCTLILFCCSKILSFTFGSMIDACTTVCFLDEIDEDKSVSSFLQMAIPQDIRFLMFVLGSYKADLNRLDLMVTRL